VILYIVLKAPVDLEGAAEIVGVFASKTLADAACTGAGTYTVAAVELDRRYSGDLRDVSVTVALDHRQFR
jgi:hypothetical protein